MLQEMIRGTEDDRGRNGRTNFTWRIKEQATRLNPLFERDDDDDLLHIIVKSKGMVL